MNRLEGKVGEQEQTIANLEAEVERLKSVLNKVGQMGKDVPKNIARLEWESVFNSAKVVVTNTEGTDVPMK